MIKATIYNFFFCNAIFLFTCLGHVVMICLYVLFTLDKSKASIYDSCDVITMITSFLRESIFPID